jgi:predicted metal-dependent hydrolase
MFQSHKLDQEWSDQLPRYWNDHSPFKTHFLNSLSIVLPKFEEFFIRTLRPLKKNITDPQQLTEYNEFIKQESYHSYAHNKYNNWLQSQGLPVDQLQESNDRILDFLLKNTSNKTCLAITICVEHITVSYASVFLKHRLVLKKMHPHFGDIWRWHAIEEIEHKSVAMDIWNQTYSDFIFQRLIMLVVFIYYIWIVGKNTLIFLQHDNQLWKWRTLTDMVSLFFDKQSGLILKSFVPWLDFMRTDFHPNDHDHTILLNYKKH